MGLFTKKVAFSLNISGITHERAQWPQVEQGLMALAAGTEEFVILEPQGGLGETLFLQTACPAPGYEDHLGYIVELSVKKGQGWQIHQCRTPDRMEICRWFRDYLERHKAPDYSAWPVVMES